MPCLASWIPNWGTCKSPDTCEKPVSYKHQAATRTMPANVRFWSDGINQVLSATGLCFGSILNLKDPFVKLEIDSGNGEAISRLLHYADLYRQILQTYKDMSSFLHPRALSTDLFRHTCSMGLLLCDRDDDFESLIGGLNFDVNADLKQIWFHGVVLDISSMFNPLPFAYPQRRDPCQKRHMSDLQPLLLAENHNLGHIVIVLFALAFEY